MRHSDIKLTMNVYTDPVLVDVRGALDAPAGSKMPEPMTGARFSRRVLLHHRFHQLLTNRDKCCLKPTIWPVPTFRKFSP
jgi:hypothetical protein